MYLVGIHYHYYFCNFWDFPYLPKTDLMYLFSPHSTPEYDLIIGTIDSFLGQGIMASIGWLGMVVDDLRKTMLWDIYWKIQ